MSTAPNRPKRRPAQVFKIGQRIRIKWSVNWPELNGTNGTVDSELYWTDEHGYIYDIVPDTWGGRKCPKEPEWSFGPRPEQLEPLIDDGRQLVTWESMQEIWTPERLIVQLT